MAFPRVSAVIFLVLLIGSLSLLCMGVFALYQTTETHQNNEEYVEGKIVAIGSKMDFELVTEAGQHLHFSCSNSCRAFMTHMQRHFYEHAMTYVFYVEGSKNHLIAVDVD
ncbi:MAG: hypothetical protein E6J31_08855 [Chloroflexi bacterium]|nr:MAG: hypothetical protein E6J36_19340 [Chloroflexota bacterium]TMC39507.1 MAG: hypothetical protein E6J31_08855 [Chloroflexota bacterium]